MLMWWADRQPAWIPDWAHSSLCWQFTAVICSTLLCCVYCWIGNDKKFASNSTCIDRLTDACIVKGIGTQLIFDFRVSPRCEKLWHIAGRSFSLKNSFRYVDCVPRWSVYFDKFVRFDATSSMEWKSSRQKIKCDRQLSAFTLLLHFTLCWKIGKFLTRIESRRRWQCSESAQMMSERLSNLEFSPEKRIRYNCCTLFAFYSILAEPCRVFFVRQSFVSFSHSSTYIVFALCHWKKKLSQRRAFAIFSFLDPGREITL